MSEPTLYINGRWVRGGASDAIRVVNPATGAVLEEVASASSDDVRQAVAAASAAFPKWAALTAKERSELLRRAGEVLRAKAGDIGRVLTSEQGKPLSEAVGEVRMAADYLVWNSEEARRVYGETIPSTSGKKRLMVIRQPVGVVGAITPWNFPASMVTRKLAPALAAGCTAILKPASATPLTAIEIFKVFDEVGLPPGTVNLVTGNAATISQVLLEAKEVRKLSFTGSTEVGRGLAEAAARRLKRVSLELGGHAPFIVFADADVDAAVEGFMASKFRNAGQTCITANRLYVHEDIAPAFQAALTERVKGLKMGNGLEEGTTVGPLINEAAVEKCEAHVKDAVSRGGKVLLGGERAALGKHFYLPTVISGVPEGAVITREETFGPVIAIQTFTDEEQVMRWANDTPYGLMAYFYTRDLGRTFRVAERLEYGMIGVNDPVPTTVEAPFGGVKDSGMGREGGHQGVREYTEEKFISLNIG